MRSKLLALLVATLLALSVAPATALAEGEPAVEVATVQELEAAITNAVGTAEQPTQIVVTQPLSTTYSVRIQGKHVDISAAAGLEGAAITQTQQRKFLFEVSDGGTLTLGQIVLQSSASASYACVNLTGGSALTLKQGAVLSMTSTAKGVIATKDDSQKTITLQSGSLIEGNGGSGYGLDVKNTRVSIQGGVIQNTDSSGICGEGNCTIDFASGAIQNNSRAGIYLDGGLSDTATFAKTAEILLGENAVISGNQLGGVYMCYGAQLTMNGGQITGNATSSWGGGVYAGTTSAVVMAGGQIANNTAAYNGGGVALEAGQTGSSGQGTAASLTMTGGSITGNHTDGQGGAVFSSSGMSVPTPAILLQGGEISGNTAKKEGGGIFLYASNQSTGLTMQGGKIIGNQSEISGGGICAYGDARLSGGEISGNEAPQGGGVLVASDGAVRVSGGIAIQGNTGAEGKASNLENGKYSTRYYAFGLDGALTGTVGVTHANPAVGEAVAAGDGYTPTDGDLSHLFYDAQDFGFALSAGRVVLATPASQPVLTTDLPGAPTVCAQGQEVALTVEAQTPAEGALTYQWYASDTGNPEDGQPIEGATGPQYLPPTDVAGTRYYYVVVTNTLNHHEAVLSSAVAAVQVEALEEHTGSVNGTVWAGSQGVPAEGATVRILRGDAELCPSQTTGADGKFTFGGLPYGQYQLVVEMQDGRVTQLVVVDGMATQEAVILPQGKQRTRVLAEGQDVPPIAVNGLQELFNQPAASDTAGVTLEDQAVIQAGGMVELQLVVKRMPSHEGLWSHLQGALAGQDLEVGMYLDVSVQKIVTPVDGAPRTVNLTELPHEVEIILEMPEAWLTMDQLGVVRLHGETLESLSTQATGEGFSVTGRYMTLRARQYSPYAIIVEGYTAPMPTATASPTPTAGPAVTPNPTATVGPTLTPSPTTPATGDPLPLAFGALGGLALGLMGVLLGVRRRRKLGK